MGDGSERRQHPRVPLNADAPVIRLTIDLQVGGQTDSAEVINIAEEGLFLATSAPLERSVSVVVELATEDGIYPARGKVVWKTDRGLGIRLTEASEPFRDFVRKLAAADLDQRWELLQTIRRAQIRAV